MVAQAGLVVQFGGDEGFTMRMMFVAALIVAAVIATQAEAQRSRMPPIPLRMTFERGADQLVSRLNIEVRNVEGGPVCVSSDYAGPARLVMTVEPARQIAAQQSEETVPSACVELEPGASLSFSYDVQALFPEQSLVEPRFCYSLPTRTGRLSDGGDLSVEWGACSQARR